MKRVGKAWQNAIEASTYREHFGLCDVPERLPEMDVEVLSDALKFGPSQLGVDGVLARRKEGASRYTCGGKRKQNAILICVAECIVSETATGE